MKTKRKETQKERLQYLEWMESNERYLAEGIEEGSKLIMLILPLVAIFILIVFILVDYLK
jgi:hypothetical protein